MRIKQRDLDRFLAAGATVQPQATDQADDAAPPETSTLADAAAEGAAAVHAILASYPPDEALALVDEVIAQFVTELDRALGTGGGPFELDAHEFMRRYDALQTGKRLT